MMIRSQESLTTEDRLRRAELLRVMLSRGPLDDAYAWDRLERYRFERREPLRMVALASTEWPVGQRGRFSEAQRLERVADLERAAADLGLPVLFAGHGQRIAAVAAARENLLDEWFAQARPAYRFGLSEVFHRPDDAPNRIREADLAATSAEHTGTAVRRFEDVDLGEWLMAGRPGDEMRAKAHRLLAPVADNPLLIDALTAYFACSLDVQRTARRLRLHPNSVRYRLRRVERILGRDLADPATITDLHLALHPSIR